jgi:hypothetical protein
MVKNRAEESKKYLERAIEIIRKRKGNYLGTVFAFEGFIGAVKSITERQILSESEVNKYLNKAVEVYNSNLR